MGHGSAGRLSDGVLPPELATLEGDSLCVKQEPVETLGAMPVGPPL